MNQSESIRDAVDSNGEPVFVVLRRDEVKEMIRQAVSEALAHQSLTLILTDRRSTESNLAADLNLAEFLSARTLNVLRQNGMKPPFTANDLVAKYPDPKDVLALKFAGEKVLMELIEELNSVGLDRWGFESESIKARRIAKRVSKK